MDGLLPKQKAMQAVFDAAPTAAELEELFKEEEKLTKFQRALPVKDHPLYEVLVAAIEQAMYGKGERHGGAATPFFDQPWAHYYQMHGRGFLTGQAAKKLEEAAHQRSGLAFEQEILGAIVYAGMAILMEREGATTG